MHAYIVHHHHHQHDIIITVLQLLFVPLLLLLHVQYMYCKDYGMALALFINFVYTLMVKSLMFVHNIILNTIAIITIVL